MSEKRVTVFGGLLLVDFLLSAIMLFTDKNLQTDFGATGDYYVHWYGVLAMGALDLVLGIAVLGVAFMAAPTQPRVNNMLARGRRVVVIGALGWTILAILAMVGIVTLYSQVGFSSMSQFAQYLFGVTAYPGALSYIPWLYDLLLAAYLLTALAGIAAWWGTRAPGPSSAAS